MLAIRIITNLAEQKGKIVISKELEATSTIFAITHEIISSAASPELLNLFGTNTAEKALIADCSFKALSLKTGFLNERKKTFVELNDLLKDKHFLATNYFSIADVLLYAILYNVPFEPKDQLQYSNVIRYFDLMQHLVRDLVPALPDLNYSDFDLDVELAVHLEEVKPEKKTKPEVASASKEKKVAPSVQTVVADVLDPSKLDIRVGKILAVEKHPEADSLYVETIDFGEETGPRTVVSGLVKYMKESELLNQFVVCLCNLKPAKMRGVESKAMVLCATSSDGLVVEFLQPPASSAIGDVVSFEGHSGVPELLLKPKQKVWELLQPHLFTTAKNQAAFKDALMKTSKGYVTIKSLKVAPIK